MTDVLTYGYRPTSDLPRNTYIVDVDTIVVGDRGTTWVTRRVFNVTAPDANAAQGLVRRRLDKNPNVIRFALVMLRQVSLVWHQGVLVPTVTVPSIFTPYRGDIRQTI